MSFVAQNISRINHLLGLFNLTKDEFLKELNKDSSSPINEEDVFTSFIKTSVLNKVDKIFKKGFAYYANPSAPIMSSEESIFFRKNSFNSVLNLRAKQVVNEFEEKKLGLSTLLKLSEIDSDRILPKFTISDDPVRCAVALRDLIYPNILVKPREFLKKLIANLAEKNVVVFEFVEHHSRKEPANILGFYLNPNVIVLQWQKYKKREIFTLAHEIGHYLLAEEEIDEKINSESIVENLSDVEKWCNKFAFAFLAGSYLKIINSLPQADVSNDYNHDIINGIAENTQLSNLAIYTHLLYIGKISKPNYKLVSDNIYISIKQAEEEQDRLNEIQKQKDIEAGKTPGGGIAKALLSPLYVQALQTALYNGFVDEYEFCRRLNIKPDKIELYLA